MTTTPRTSSSKSDLVNILIVDDEPVLRRVLSMSFAKGPFQVTLAESAEDALKKASELDALQVALIDKNLPDAQGLSLISPLRDRFPFAEFIILTGYASVESAQEAVRLGAFDYITKPFSDLNRLELLVTSASRTSAQNTERHRLLEELRQSNERYALVLDGTQEGILDWDLVRNAVHYSPRFEIMMGLEPGTLEPTVESWLECIHGDDRQPVRAALEAHIRGRATSFNVSYRIQHRDTSMRWMVARGVALKRSDGTSLRFAGSQLDETLRRRAEQQLEERVLYDTITKTLNRQVFLDRIQQALRYLDRSPGRAFTLAVIDIDAFRRFNEALGFALTDRLLLDIAQRIKNQLRAVDSVARVGEATFGILIENTGRESRGLVAVSRIQESFEEPFTVDGREVHVRLTFGIVHESRANHEPESVLRNAQLALQKAKSSVSVRHCVYTPELRVPEHDILGLDRSLRLALREGHIVPFYQPIVRSSDYKIVGFEALARWTHDDGSVRSPAFFIPWAEESGLVVPLNDQMVRQAVRFVDSLDPALEDKLTITLNITPSELLQGVAVERLDRILRETGVAADRLQVELLESTLVQDLEKAADEIERLRKLGVKVGLDDFGTGFSSLSYLHRIAFDFFKIDRVFVASMTSDRRAAAIVQTVMALSNSLEVPIVAEGVETEAHRKMLEDLGCTMMQGYLFSKPVAQDDARDLVSTEPKWTLKSTSPTR